jgi:short-subunit dehydrogenase
MKWSGSTVLISGASSGIGEELARQAMARGSRVGLLARSTEALEGLAAQLGDDCVAAPADVTSQAEVRAAVERVERALGPVDICVANAGIGLYGPFVDAAADRVEALMATNYLGTVHLFQAVLPSMIARRRGHLVAVGSIAGRIGAPFEAAYSATKFAVTGLTEALSVEVAPFGVGVSLVNPGPVATPFFENRGHRYERPRPRPVPAGEVASSILRAVERNHAESFVPAMLRQAFMVRSLVPPLFRFGTARVFADELKTYRLSR